MADLDAPSTTAERREALQRKPLLRRIYADWYARLRQALPPEEGPVVEVGTGPGFLKQVLPEAIATDLIPGPHLDVVLDACCLPFAGGCLRAVLMTDVLHHIPRPRAFLAEAARCVRAGGVLAMIEPWVTPWSGFVYARVAHEPFQPRAAQWEFAPGGPLSQANTALPWILFSRDRATFEAEYPMWRIDAVQPFMPLLYILSGGFSYPPLVPAATYGLWARLERWLARWADRLAMFACIVLRRIEAPDQGGARFVLTLPA